MCVGVLRGGRCGEGGSGLVKGPLLRRLNFCAWIRAKEHDPE